MPAYRVSNHTPVIYCFLNRLHYDSETNVTTNTFEHKCLGNVLIFIWRGIYRDYCAQDLSSGHTSEHKSHFQSWLKQQKPQTLNMMYNNTFNLTFMFLYTPSHLTIVSRIQCQLSHCSACKHRAPPPSHPWIFVFSLWVCDDHLRS